MLRATIWTVGLFGAGTVICRLYPGAWTEPLVLFALGLALLFVSARTARGTAPAVEKARLIGNVAQTAPTSSPVPAAATVQVERTA